MFIFSEIFIRAFIVHGYNLGIIGYSVFSSVMNSLKGYGKKILDSDEKLIYKYLPNANFKIIRTKDREYKIRTADIGFGNIGFVDDGISGEILAVAVGDSFTACIGVDYEFCWVEILEDRLGCDIVNMGVEGYSLMQKVIMLEEYALKLNPKIVFLDVNLTDPPDDFFFANGTARPIPHPINRFYERGLQYYFASYLVIKFMWDNLTGYTYDRKFKRYLSKYKEGITYTISAIERAFQLCDKFGAHLILMLFHSIKPVIDFAKSKRISFVDLQKLFEIRRYKDLYLPHDGHLNMEGNKATAEILYDFLVENEFIKFCSRK